MTIPTTLRYPGDYCAAHVPSATRACLAPNPMLRAAFIFALVTPSPTRASIRYQRAGQLDVMGDTDRPMATVGDFEPGTWILVEQSEDESGAGALWRLACVGEWAPCGAARG